MRISSDDTVYRVDNRFLGPQGITIARVGIRYQAIGVGFMLWIPATIAVRWLGVGGAGALLGSVGATVAATWLIMHFVDYDRPLVAQLAVLVHEVTAPRPVRKATSITLAPGRVPITALPLERRRGAGDR